MVSEHCQCVGRLTHRQKRMVSEHCQCVGGMLLCFLCCGVVAVLLQCSENDFVSCRWAAREHTATARAVSVQRARGRHKRSTSRVLNERDRHKSSECSSRAKCSTARRLLKQVFIWHTKQCRAELRPSVNTTLSVGTLS